MASGQPFASRSYAGSKLPERSANTNAMPFSASSFSRHRGLGASAPTDFSAAEGAKQQQQQAVAQNAPPQPHGPAQDTNPLNRLTEEQREEINEAVCAIISTLDVFLQTSPSARRDRPGPKTANPREQNEKLTHPTTVHPLRPRPRSPPRLPRAPRRLPRTWLHPN